MLFSNEGEALTYTGKDSIDEAIQELLKVTNKLVLTHGSKGATVINPDNSVKIDPVNVDAIDTNGAGDMFAGAFMYGLLNGMSDEQAGNLASESAADIVTVYGARLEKQRQLEILSKHAS